MNKAYALWRRLNKAPFHFPMTEEIWKESMYLDVDSDGNLLFDDLKTVVTDHGMIQYGHTAFGFDDSGSISNRIHHPVIRFLCFDAPEDGEKLLDNAMTELGTGQRIYAFFHYFGMSACGRHGKLHEKDAHVEKLLLSRGFTVEHENVYYARNLSESDIPAGEILLRWQPLSPGSCRNFAAVQDGVEVGWGQVHFLPQGDIAYLRWIFVDEQFQHQGIGSAMMKSLFAELFAMGIRRFDTDTALNNRIAQKYYEKTGFTNCGITRSYDTK